MDIYFLTIIFLGALAVADLIVGVSNDAVNFLNSSFGSLVASRKKILIIASLGLIAGVVFSSGMMEVARKGIFHPQYFTMPELVTVFLAVMLTDILLLDTFNAFALPTSTTVSIVFELLGAAVAISTLKIAKAGESYNNLVKYINSSKALTIILGILLSVIIAFFTGAIIQYFSRLIFTFDFKSRMKRYGALWGGLALTSITYFILIKGAKGAAFITPETLGWIKTHTFTVSLISFISFSVLLQALLIVSKIDVLKIIVLIGTFALAMAFAANDLVNFIGVPLAGLSSYNLAIQSSSPTTEFMTGLQSKTPAHTILLLLAGIIMAFTLWFSKKARNVTKTEINLARQDEGFERFGSSHMSRSIVRLFTNLNEGFSKIIPRSFLNIVNRRFKDVGSTLDENEHEKPSFDLIRASVNLMVASILISIATSFKLPLSTTYVTFMVAMGTSFSDRAWGSDSAVYRVAGVFTVIGGWFVTAFVAFIISGFYAFILFKFKIYGFIFLILISFVLIYRNHSIHKRRESDSKELDIFNLKKIKDVVSSIETTLEHAGLFLKKVSDVLAIGFNGLAGKDRLILKNARKEAKKNNYAANVIVANIFKTLRLLNKEKKGNSDNFAMAINSLQGIAECQNDLVIRAYLHVENNHMGLLKVQLEELSEVRKLLLKLLDESYTALINKDKNLLDKILSDKSNLKKMIERVNKNQVARIKDESSKTRLSILFYGFTRDLLRIKNHTINLIEVFSALLEELEG